jgi:hypothetical protein
MLMTWVNHASFILDTQAVRLICDPWLAGASFNNGWRLLSPTKMAYQEFSSITHIWFSHEHPDHFSPPNLKQIPEEYRRRIIVLFHATKDQRVVNVCKSLGFKVQELPEHQAVEIAQGVRIICGRQDDLDSWSAVLAEGKSILNMNDCLFDRHDDLCRIKQAIGKVDVLLSQFSYANWVGNSEDHTSRKMHASRKLAEITRQVRIFQPAWFIPFASFVYFSHSENSYMNSTVNRVADVYEFAGRELRVPSLVLYPGDTWEVGTPRDSSASIHRYAEDFERALRESPFQSPQVEFARLKEAATTFIAKCTAKNNQLLLQALPRAVVRLSDLGLDAELSFRKGLTEIKDGQPDIVLSSESLLNCLTTEWGGETLWINGRFQLPAGGSPRHFFWIFRVARHNSFGDSLNFAFLYNQAVRKARSAVAG